MTTKVAALEGLGLHLREDVKRIRELVLCLTRGFYVKYVEAKGDLLILGLRLW